ncbi:MAG: helix-turn-helix transcriptional regulator [Opitutales bacterium]|nr:helix-turn-helix transcriptional regulator [Opitutales bacterium]
MCIKMAADLVNDWSMPILAHLCMQRAATMLRSFQAKVDDIARMVGYASMYSFSVDFRRWSGRPPPCIQFQYCFDIMKAARIRIRAALS